MLSVAMSWSQEKNPRHNWRCSTGISRFFHMPRASSATAGASKAAGDGYGEGIPSYSLRMCVYMP